VSQIPQYPLNRAASLQPTSGLIAEWQLQATKEAGNLKRGALPLPILRPLRAATSHLMVSARYKAPAIDTKTPAYHRATNSYFNANEVCTGWVSICEAIISEITMLSIFRKLMKNQDGATAIEYTLIAALISVAAIAAMGTVGGKVSNVLSNVANAMN